jgi:hypothetical protein
MRDTFLKAILPNTHENYFGAPRTLLNAVEHVIRSHTDGHLSNDNYLSAWSVFDKAWQKMDDDICEQSILFGEL